VGGTDVGAAVGPQAASIRLNRSHRLRIVVILLITFLPSWKGRGHQGGPGGHLWPAAFCRLTADDVSLAIRQRQVGSV
jgi:hypothetical protein